MTSFDATRHTTQVTTLMSSPSTPEANTVQNEAEEDNNRAIEGREGEANQEESVVGGEEEEDVQAPPGAKRKRERKEPVALVREDGKSLLPFSRVQKIIKADKVCCCPSYSSCF